MNKYIREGMKSFDESMGMHINPYVSESIRYNEFQLGWTQALMRSFDQVSKRYRAEAKALQQKELKGKKSFKLIQFK
jgi:hypothetical protein